MVVDRTVLSANLTRFYDFRGKSVLYVGAGGGQLLGPASGVRSVVAIDSNAKSLGAFRSEAKTKWAGIPVRFIPRKFESVNAHGDVVYFEFCLHEMDSPRRALEHARSLAPETVVMDHLPKSEWIYYGVEEELVQRSADIIKSFGAKRSRRHTIHQHFEDHDALAARLAEVGEESLKRALEFKGKKNIKIRMDNGLFLL